ncbi:Phosphoribosylglycinamide formyltransferase [Corynebacterium freiburgense]|nr:phosphoribosylglycinamide formyltransferase [Corynebacterium freiburgense]WJZ02068.1 Phosphoribosylglycinamide formyltransferase [Corynebacterium freiburgense]
MPVVVLASGTGTLLQAIINAQGEHYTVTGVVTDQECEAVARAVTAGIPARTIALAQCTSREQWNVKLAEAVAEFQPQLVISAGFMKILGAPFLQRFPGKIINTHPALLPAFPGAHAVRDALAYGVKVTGATVHIVDEGVDTGPIIAQVPVSVFPEDTEATLHERIKQQERTLIVSVLSNPQLHP